MMAAALSVTHQHLQSVVATEFVPPAVARPVRILDAGCGDGLLLDYLARNLGKNYPGVTIEFHGFDVSDHGVQASGYFQDTVAMLSRNHPHTLWSGRLALIAESDARPWCPGQFDLIISNQVMEHVRNHRVFFSEIFRTLRPDGFSVHVFPLRHVLVKPHLQLPWCTESAAVICYAAPFTSFRGLDWASTTLLRNHWTPTPSGMPLTS